MVLEALASQGLVRILEGQQALLQERRGRSASSEDGAKSRDLSLSSCGILFEPHHLAGSVF